MARPVAEGAQPVAAGTSGKAHRWRRIQIGCASVAIVLGGLTWAIFRHKPQPLGPYDIHFVDWLMLTQVIALAAWMLSLCAWLGATIAPAIQGRRERMKRLNEKLDDDKRELEEIKRICEVKDAEIAELRSALFALAARTHSESLQRRESK